MYDPAKVSTQLSFVSQGRGIKTRKLQDQTFSIVCLVFVWFCLFVGFLSSISQEREFEYVTRDLYKSVTLCFVYSSRAIFFFDIHFHVNIIIMDAGVKKKKKKVYACPFNIHPCMAKHSKCSL